MNDHQCDCGGADHHAHSGPDRKKVKSPLHRWMEYCDFVGGAQLPAGDERQLAFHAGAESVFKFLEEVDVPIIGPLAAYREANRAAAMSPEDRLIAEIEAKTALGEIE